MPKRIQYSYRITISPRLGKSIERAAAKDGIKPSMWLRLFVIRGLQKTVKTKKATS